MGGRVLAPLCGEFLFCIICELGTTDVAGLVLCWWALLGVRASGLGARVGLAPCRAGLDPRMAVGLGLGL